MQNELKSTIREWEKLRIAYNVIIGTFGLWLSWGLQDSMGGLPEYVFLVLLYGVSANVFFSLGPLTELYVKVMTPLKPDRLRLPVFAVGTLFSAVVTAIVYFTAELSIPPFPLLDL